MSSTKQPFGVILPIAHGEQGYFAQSYSIGEQIKSNLVVLLKTKKGERRMNPEFGSGLWNILFENATDDLNPIIENTIRKDISRWMPYIVVGSVSITTNTSNSNELDVAMNYTVPSVGILQPQYLQVSMAQAATLQ